LFYNFIQRDASCFPLELGALVAVAVQGNVVGIQVDRIAYGRCEVVVGLVEEAVHQVDVEALETGQPYVIRGRFVNMRRSFAAKVVEQFFRHGLYAHADAAVPHLKNRFDFFRFARRYDRCSFDAEYHVFSECK